MIIEFKNVSKIYKLEKRTALEDVNFKVDEGEFVSLIGPSGEGKTTVLKIISGIEEPTKGSVVKPKSVSMVFQTIALFPWLDVFENVAIGLRSKKLSEQEIEKIVLHYLEMVKMKNSIYSRPADLSGGQKQRIGIARALAVEPQVLLLDEPFSALDPKTTAELHDDILEIWKATGKTIVMVSHLIEEAVSLAQRILLIKKYKLDNIFNVDFPYPRREQEERFIHEVSKIRKEFFK